MKDTRREQRPVDYDAVRIKIASPDTIVNEWSHGEVTKPDTLNYRTLKPEKDGLFCERIFGPERDYECACGKYKKKRFQNTTCDRCNVLVTTSRVRRTRMGHIQLAVPIAHIWFVKSAPSKIGTLLDMTIKDLERVLYYESFIVIDPGDSPYEKMELLEVDEFYEIKDKVGENFVAMMGAEAVRDLLGRINLKNEALDLRTRLKFEESALRKQKLIKKLKIVDAFIKSGNEPAHMIMEALPVLPPTLRPLVPLEGGRFATADFNDLYRRVITRNNRLKTLLEIRAPEVILRNEKRMLQEAVDALIDNSRKARPVRGRGNRPLKSLTDQLKGKQGRFRQNLLGKRVDYSGRSVITVGPDLKLYQCGLPKDMAVELFKPYLIERLQKMGEIDKVKNAKKLIEKKQPEIWSILEDVVKDYPVLLNRAPTLHRLGIQAFMPVLTDNKSIQLHPMVCVPFNADFDGDQMGVYVPLSMEAQIEARVLMLSTRNLLLPANGRLAMAANQDIVLGCYYLTMAEDEPNEDIRKLRHFYGPDEVIAAYENEERLCGVKGEAADERSLDLHNWIRVKVDGDYVVTTVGRVIMNQIIPSEVGFQNVTYDKGKINDLAMLCYDAVGQWRTALFLDELKVIGFRYATRAGVTFSFDDIVVPKRKDEIIDESEKDVKKIWDMHQQGGITEDERMQRVVDTWKKTTVHVTDEMMEELSHERRGLNSIYMMFKSGARGSKDQIKQLGGMRGLMDKPSKIGSTGGADVIETPIKSNFKQGLTVLEYFVSTHGARKGLADTALKTADAGYLTRRLVDVAQNAIITMEDCGTNRGVHMTVLKEGNEVVQTLAERIQGRYAAEDIVDPVTGKVMVFAGEEISNKMARTLQNHGLITVFVRSVLTCEAERGLCSKCYGRNLGTLKPVQMGDPVGVIAAQSIGEPGTQLTLRTFHIGGAASTITDLAEVVSSHDGIVKFDRMNTVTNTEDMLISVSHLGKLIIVEEKDPNKVIDEYKVEYAATVHVRDGQKIVANTKLLSWDQFNNPLISTAQGVLHYEHFVKDITYKEEYNDITFSRDITIIESKDRKKQPQFKIVDDDGTVGLIPLPAGLVVRVEDGSFVHTGDILGQTSRMTIKQRDITGGLPRVQDLFEARVPKEKAQISDIDGVVTIGGLKKTGRDIFVTPPNGLFASNDGQTEIILDEAKNQYVFVLSKKTVYAENDGKCTIVKDGRKVSVEIAKRGKKPSVYNIPRGMDLLVTDGKSVKKGFPLCGISFSVPPEQESIVESGDMVIEGQPLAGRRYSIPTGKRIIVHQGDMVESGDPLSDGPLDPHDMLVKGVIEAQVLILNEIQEIYRKQGVKIDDKHVSVIIRQMFKKVRITDSGSTSFLQGDVVDKIRVERENREVISFGKQPAQFEQLLLGITKISLLTDSWLSSASFQETTKVLTKAAIEGSMDYLEGLKESIILGHRIPVGTGTKIHNNMIKEAVANGDTVAQIISKLAHPDVEEEAEDILDF
ncbi:MAG: DNA-directed RNA polymerase subunit beta' [Candidatus Cloacimonadaceae bacterium]|jgi:DNA-directed RNA polymerase subunit beta'|nr:DNA-directed RNA polymerase subunit beta' [Candidatus Cloacimonadota bacterium]MCB5255847.1 DNA-directed RNA polymerase subunit beta' [Candidatus Cloacimonadota bacterium]MCK9178120.1 DNA-directed RNA polymerase subunit beta' [Candidatus Cloacimonadota bacterium]MCK9242093.1 DNA-directed RNA polymerase subunit beta' [Candidatus Cloacimonadota bacterium]MDY0126921.1 DNA-directed RNA polymerase subunit beta' [Candidatus Cloacimonadaceae bacterium]